MNFSPTQSLILLVLLGLSISGWFYGIYWKRVADGEVFTNKERLIIQLQDQVRVLSDKNEELNTELSRITGTDKEIVGKNEPGSNQTGAAIDPGVLAPFEKVELPKKGL